MYELGCLLRAKSDDGTGSGGNLWPQVGTLLANGSSDGGALHLTLGVDDDAGIVLEVNKNAVPATPGLALTHDDSGHHLLLQLGLALLDGGDDHVADTGGRQTVEAPLDALDGDDVQILGTTIVGAVHDGTHGETQGHAETITSNTSSSYNHRG